jgi:hypothetical protein
VVTAYHVLQTAYRIDPSLKSVYLRAGPSGNFVSITLFRHEVFKVSDVAFLHARSQNDHVYADLGVQAFQFQPMVQPFGIASMHRKLIKPDGTRVDAVSTGRIALDPVTGLINHRINSVGGDSGSPLIVKRNGASICIGIHLGELQDCSANQARPANSFIALWSKARMPTLINQSGWHNIQVDDAEEPVNEADADEVDDESEETLRWRILYEIDLTREEKILAGIDRDENDHSDYDDEDDIYLPEQYDSYEDERDDEGKAYKPYNAQAVKAEAILNKLKIAPPLKWGDRVELAENLPKKVLPVPPVAPSKKRRNKKKKPATVLQSSVPPKEKEELDNPVPLNSVTPPQPKLVEGALETSPEIITMVSADSNELKVLQLKVKQLESERLKLEAANNRLLLRQKRAKSVKLYLNSVQLLREKYPELQNLSNELMVREIHRLKPWPKTWKTLLSKFPVMGAHASEVELSLAHYFSN